MEKFYSPSYLAKALEFTQSMKRQTYEELDLKENHQVLEIGCGQGFDVIEIAKRIGGKGFVTGVDHDTDMLKAAEDNRLASGLKNIRFLKADAENLPFQDETFDSVRVERVFQHLTNPLKVAEECCRVLKPGGRIVIVETDWPGLTFFVNRPDIHRKIIDFLVNKFVKNGFASRYLINYLKLGQIKAIHQKVFPIIIENYNTAEEFIKLSQIEEKMKSLDFIEDAELIEWRKMINEYKENDYFTGSVNMIMASGTK